MRRETCAERLQKALSIRNMKAIELCEKTGIPKSAMSQYINGKFEPKQDRLHLISKALDVSEPWLMGFDVPMYRTDFSSEENRNICQNITRLWEEIENPPNPDNIIGITLPFVEIQKNEYQFTNEVLEQFASYFGVGIDVFLTTPAPTPEKETSGIDIMIATESKDLSDKDKQEILHLIQYKKRQTEAPTSPFQSSRARTTINFEDDTEHIAAFGGMEDIDDEPLMT